MGWENENVLAEYSPLSLLVGGLYPDSPGVLVSLTGAASNDPVNTRPPLPPVLLRPPAGATRGLGGSRMQGFGIFTNQPLNMFCIYTGCLVYIGLKQGAINQLRRPKIRQP